MTFSTNCQVLVVRTNVFYNANARVAPFSKAGLALALETHGVQLVHLFAFWKQFLNIRETFSLKIGIQRRYNHCAPLIGGCLAKGHQIAHKLTFVNANHRVGYNALSVQVRHRDGRFVNIVVRTGHVASTVSHVLAVLVEHRALSGVLGASQTPEKFRGFTRPHSAANECNHRRGAVSATLA